MAMAADNRDARRPHVSSYLVRWLLCREITPHYRIYYSEPSPAPPEAIRMQKVHDG